MERSPRVLVASMAPLKAWGDDSDNGISQAGVPMNRHYLGQRQDFQEEDRLFLSKNPLNHKQACRPSINRRLNNIIFHPHPSFLGVPIALESYQCFVMD